MHKKLKFLQNMATCLATIAAFVLSAGPLFAGWVYDGNDDNNGHPRRLVRVVFGTARECSPNCVIG